MSSLNDYVFNLRIFESSTDGESREDARQRRIRVNATRTYLAILLLVLLIFCVISLITSETKLVQLVAPSLERIQTLPNDARCFCSESSLPYQSFTSLEVRFHEICSSDFVSNQWIEGVLSSGDSNSILPEHSRAFASAQFQALASLCGLSQTHINQAVIAFGQKSLFSPDILLNELFVAQMHRSVDQLMGDVVNEFQQHLQLIRQMIVGNQLVSGPQSNFIAMRTLTNNDQIQLDLLPTRYTDQNGHSCDCSTHSSCVDVGWSEQLGNSSWTKVPGVLVGCLPMDAILQSTIACFYDQMCLNALMALFNIRQNVTVMSQSQVSRFTRTASIQSITDLMMVERWNFTVSYSDYYHRCAPNSCIYSTKERSGVWAVLFKLIGILGGTTMILGIFMPLSIRGLERSQVAPAVQGTNGQCNSIISARESTSFIVPSRCGTSIGSGSSATEDVARNELVR
jgi:hypothetical protein